MGLITSLLNCSPLEEIAIAVASGLALHLCFFIHGEDHMKAPFFFFRLHVVLFAALTYVEIAVKHQNVFPGTKQAFELFTVYILSPLTSIFIYRRYCHRLRHFPGCPSMASVTKLWQTTRTLDSQNPILLDGLHRKYGDFVRTSQCYYLIVSVLTRWHNFKARQRSRYSHRRSNRRLTALPTSATKLSGTIYFCL